MPLKISAPLLKESQLAKTDERYKTPADEPTMVTFRQASQEANDRRDDLLSAFIDQRNRLNTQAQLSELLTTLDSMNGVEPAKKMDFTETVIRRMVAQGPESADEMVIVPWSRFRWYTVFLTIAGCNIMLDDKKKTPLFKFKDNKIAMTPDEFKAAWGTIQDTQVCDELYEKALDVNPAWDRDRNDEQAQKSGEAGSGES
jgi:hypothetical protein